MNPQWGKSPLREENYPQCVLRNKWQRRSAKRLAEELKYETHMMMSPRVATKAHTRSKIKVLHTQIPPRRQRHFLLELEFAIFEEIKQLINRTPRRWTVFPSPACARQKGFRSPPARAGIKGAKIFSGGHGLPEWKFQMRSPPTRAGIRVREKFRVQVATAFLKQPATGAELCLLGLGN
jgi:hypothetical protein